MHLCFCFRVFISAQLFLWNLLFRDAFLGFDIHFSSLPLSTLLCFAPQAGDGWTTSPPDMPLAHTVITLVTAFVSGHMHKVLTANDVHISTFKVNPSLTSYSASLLLIPQC